MSGSQPFPAEVDSSRRLEDAITNPGTVKINVEGAFIVEDLPATTPDSIAEEEGVHYERKDIRLPHHTGVVSHVAVDVSAVLSLPRNFPSPVVATFSRRVAKHARKVNRQQKLTRFICNLARRLFSETSLFHTRTQLRHRRGSPEFH
jgi:hypothetical protein